jgi:hypothetical protein
MQGSAQTNKNSIMNNKREANTAVGQKKKELPNGYTYKFKGSDAILDELSTFIKTERLCCDFFDYSLKIDGDGAETWLVISGPAGAKDFIKSELEL